jgi:hypothetical protein
MDRPFMEHPSGDFETAVDAMADAIKRLRALPEWDKWITFHAQGMGSRVDSYLKRNITVALVCLLLTPIVGEAIFALVMQRWSTNTMFEFNYLFRIKDGIRRSCQNGMTAVCFSLPRVDIPPEKCVSRSGETNAHHGRVPETLAPLDTWLFSVLKQRC